jgi:hypothetical protein
MAKLVELNLRPDTRTLRQFGFIALAGFGLLAALAFGEVGVFRAGLGHARQAVAGCLAAVGLLCAIFSLAYPQANRPIFVGLSVAFFPIGIVVSYVLLAALFFVVVGPTALMIRLFAKDPMNRGYDPAAKTYWTGVRKSRLKDSYFRQF